MYLEYDAVTEVPEESQKHDLEQSKSLLFPMPYTITPAETQEERTALSSCR
jgi:hypothetical protein